jgi:prolyl oligopeptidase
VKDGTRYPAVLLTAGENDPRVDAWHAKKMAARLQAASSSGLPVLLRVSGFGHGMGTPLDERVTEYADINAFLFLQLGVRWQPPASATAARDKGTAVKAAPAN